MVSRTSLISGDASFRSSVTEIAVTVNYDAAETEIVKVIRGKSRGNLVTGYARPKRRGVAA